jgi:hypothetical protein
MVSFQGSFFPDNDISLLKSFTVLSEPKGVSHNDISLLLSFTVLNEPKGVSHEVYKDVCFVVKMLII